MSFLKIKIVLFYFSCFQEFVENFCRQGICDGAGCIILASEEACTKHNLKPLARVIGYGIAGYCGLFLVFFQKYDTWTTTTIWFENISILVNYKLFIYSSVHLFDQ